MPREPIKRFDVNGRQYAIRAMPADQAFRFGLKAGAVIATILPAAATIAGQQGAGSFVAALSGAAIDDAKLAALCEEARPYLVLPDNSEASNAASFDAWFSQHPEDLFQASLLAAWKLVQDFLPPSLSTIAAGINFNSAAASK
jgi:hypothetical protein